MPISSVVSCHVVFRSASVWTFSTMRRILFLDDHRAMRAFQLLVELLCAASNATARVRRKSQPLTTANQLGWNLASLIQKFDIGSPFDAQDVIVRYRDGLGFTLCQVNTGARFGLVAPLLEK
jgi:hypothetical protein